MSTATLNALTPALGAQIDGIDVGSLSDTDFDWLLEAWSRHKVLFITDQHIDLDALLLFSRRFGPLM